MRVPRKVDYAVRAAVELAALPTGVALPAGELAERAALPRRFVEQQVSALARAGLVTCRRGPGGGCMLALPADGITVGDVVQAVAGPLLEPPFEASGPVADMWEAAALHLRDFLGETNLSQLSARTLREHSAGGYQI